MTHEPSFDHRDAPPAMDDNIDLVACPACGTGPLKFRAWMQEGNRPDGSCLCRTVYQCQACDTAVDEWCDRRGDLTAEDAPPEWW